MANPFDDQPVKSYTMGGGGSIEDDVDFYEKEIEKYMQQSLDSTQRSRAHLDNSEKIGTQTAQDLLEQREKLEKTDKNLDEIHRTTQMTQRNLNSLKSVFGGFFKNKFSRKPADPKDQEMPQSKSATMLNDTVGRMGNQSSSSFSGSSGSGPTLSESSRQAIQGTRWEAMDKQIDENLDAMSSNLRNLQMLGTALGQEVEDQNQLLDRIHSKAERNDTVVRSQDHQMKKLLGYKGEKPQDAAGLAYKK